MNVGCVSVVYSSLMIISNVRWFSVFKSFMVLNRIWSGPGAAKFFSCRIAFLSSSIVI